MSLRKTEALNKASFKNLINLQNQLVPQKKSRSKSRANRQKTSSFSKTHNRSRGLTQNYSEKQLANSRSRGQTLPNQPRERQKIFNKTNQNIEKSSSQEKQKRKKQDQIMKQIITMKNTLTTLQKNLQAYSNKENKCPNLQNFSQIEIQQNAKLRILQLNSMIDQFNIDFKTQTQHLTDKYINVEHKQQENIDFQIPDQLKHPQIIVQKADTIIERLNMKNLQQKLIQTQKLFNKKKV